MQGEIASAGGALCQQDESECATGCCYGHVLSPSLFLKSPGYHLFCCELSGIMYWIELAEGLDRPPELGFVAEHESLGKTVRLMLRMCKSTFCSSMLMILDSGFCVCCMVLLK